jgi:hypothetical protein
VIVEAGRAEVAERAAVADRAVRTETGDRMN